MLEKAVAAIFQAAGLGASAARAVAESLVAADLRGVSSHGCLLVPMYIDRLEAGSVSKEERASAIVDTGAIAVLDAGNALGQLTSDQAMNLAVDKAHRHGVGAVVVRRAFHFGGAFRYVMAAAEQGCLGVAASNTRPLMPAPGGAEPVVGNNPIAFGIPVAGRDPIVLDMALSEAALGKVRLAAADGREIPLNWATDSEGRPTADPAAALTGMLLPAGGHKGFGLALIIDMLTGVLSGGASGSAVQGLYADVAAPNNCAHFFLALDASAFDPSGEFAHRAAALAQEVLRSRVAPGTERVLLPGQIEQERQARAMTEGIVLQPSVLDGLRRSAEQVGAVLPSLDPCDSNEQEVR
ncbi:Ldh family oxidoreductase [Phycicoccus ginsengisoli]